MNLSWPQLHSYHSMFRSRWDEAMRMALAARFRGDRRVSAMWLETAAGHRQVIAKTLELIRLNRERDALKNTPIPEKIAESQKSQEPPRPEIYAGVSVDMFSFTAFRSAFRWCMAEVRESIHISTLICRLTAMCPDIPDSLLRYWLKNLIELDDDLSIDKQGYLSVWDDEKPRKKKRSFHSQKPKTAWFFAVRDDTDCDWAPIPTACGVATQGCSYAGRNASHTINNIQGAFHCSVFT